MSGRTGTLFIISAPSGAGKTSLVKALVEQLEDVQISISHTTRGARPGETGGVNYHFVTEEEFKRLVNEGVFLEHANVFGNAYGTSRDWVKETLRQGIDVILEIDWQGAYQVRNQIPGCIGIFILPPSLATLRQRLIDRNQDDSLVIKKRIQEAQHEMSHYNEYDYLLVNDDFDLAVSQLKTIVSAERLKTSRQLANIKRLLESIFQES